MIKVLCVVIMPGNCAENSVPEMEIHQIFNFLLAFIIFHQIQLSVFGNVKLAGLMSLIAASRTFNFSLCCGVCYSLAQSHCVYQLGGRKMIVENLVRGMQCCLGFWLWWVGTHVCSEFFLNFRNCSITLHVLGSNTSFWDPCDVHSSLQNHSKWSLPRTGRQVVSAKVI